jgi:hypothetical protein
VIVLVTTITNEYSFFIDDALRARLRIVAVVDRVISQRRSNVTGSLPEGFTSPNRISASAVPPSCPGYHAWTSAGTCSSHAFISTLPPDVMTTIVFLLAAAISLINSSCPSGSRKVLSALSASDSASKPAATTTTSALQLAFWHCR